MPGPRDCLGAMQAQAYLEEDDFHMPMDDEQDPRMQDFFRQIEEMRDTAAQVQKEVNQVKQLQNDILSSPMVDAKAKQGLDDAMNSIKKKANTIRTGLKKMEQAIEQEEKTKLFIIIKLYSEGGVSEPLGYLIRFQGHIKNLY